MYTVDKTGTNVLTFRFKVEAGWEQWVNLSSDHHFDNLHCDRQHLKADLEKIKERDAIALQFGDTFCAMQGKWDKRANMDDLRPELKAQNYLDLLVSTAAEFYGPYAKYIKLLGQGNHETSVRGKHGTDLLSNLTHRLNADHGGDVALGGYGGWVIFKFEHVSGGHRKSVNLKYHHGAGGGGPVTRGVIQTNRQATYLPDADIVVNGHTHDGWVVPLARERLTRHGKVYRDVQEFVRTPSYKDEYNDGSGGWHVERWGPPKPLGCAWLHFFYDGSDVQHEITMSMK